MSNSRAPRAGFLDLGSVQGHRAGHHCSRVLTARFKSQHCSLQALSRSGDRVLQSWIPGLSGGHRESFIR